MSVTLSQLWIVLTDMVVMNDILSVRKKPNGTNVQFKKHIDGKIYCKAQDEQKLIANLCFSFNSLRYYKCKRIFYNQFTAKTLSIPFPSIRTLTNHNTVSDILRTSLVMTLTVRYLSPGGEGGGAGLWLHHSKIYLIPTAGSVVF